MLSHEITWCISPALNSKYRAHLFYEIHFSCTQCTLLYVCVHEIHAHENAVRHSLIPSFTELYIYRGPVKRGWWKIYFYNKFFTDQNLGLCQLVLACREEFHFEEINKMISLPINYSCSNEYHGYLNWFFVDQRAPTGSFAPEEILHSSLVYLVEEPPSWPNLASN